MIQMLDDQHPQDDFDWGGGTPEGSCPWEALAQVVFDGLKEDIVIEQGVELGQHGIDLHAQGRNVLEQVHRVVALAEHTSPPDEQCCNHEATTTSAVNRFSPGTLTGTRLLHQKLVLEGVLLEHQELKRPGSLDWGCQAAC